MAHAPTDLLPRDFFMDGVSRPVKFGKSFRNDPTNQDEHISIMYDFKTPSSDKTKTTMDIGSDNNVAINVRGENDENTVYKGSMQKGSKDCFLIMDHITGEITIERVTSCVRVKRTRGPGGNSRQISTTPQDHSKMNRNTPPAISDSMPDLDFADDDDDDDSMGNNQPPQQQQQQQQQHQPLSANGASGGGMPSMPNGVGSDSSGSSSSSSSSSSDSDSDDEQQHQNKNINRPQQQQQQAPVQPPPMHSSKTGISNNIVIDDLELSSASEDEM